MLGLAAVGAAASGLMQRKGWSYHIVPIELFDCVLAGILAARWLDRHDSRLGKHPVAVTSALAALFLLFGAASGEAPWRELGYANADEETNLRALLIQSAADAPALILSPRIWPVYPALNYARSHQTLHALNIWELQGFYRECLPDGRLYRDIEEMDGAERTTFDNIAEDFAADPPKVVIIDLIPGIPRCGEKVFSLLDYLMRHPRFAGTWPRYEFFVEDNDLLFYRRTE
jgi:hypothetical protein